MKLFMEIIKEIISGDIGGGELNEKDNKYIKNKSRRECHTLK